MDSWNFRVIKVYDELEEYFAIAEVYYDEAFSSSMLIVRDGKMSEME